MAIDWWEVAKGAASLLGAGTGGLALYLNRRDAKRAALAAKPTARLYLNPHPEESGWFLIKIIFENVKAEVLLTSAEIISPKDVLIAPRRKALGTGAIETVKHEQARKVSVNWTVNPPLNGQRQAGFAHLGVLMPAGRMITTATLRISGHFCSGMQDELVINAKGSVESDLG